MGTMHISRNASVLASSRLVSLTFLRKFRGIRATFERSSPGRPVQSVVTSRSILSTSRIDSRGKHCNLAAFGESSLGMTHLRRGRSVDRIERGAPPARRPLRATTCMFGEGSKQGDSATLAWGCAAYIIVQRSGIAQDLKRECALPILGMQEPRRLRGGLTDWGGLMSLHQDACASRTKIRQPDRGLNAGHLFNAPPHSVMACYHYVTRDSCISIIENPESCKV
jgi:hypothetical protein